MILRFVANSEKCRKYTFLPSVQIIMILHSGGYQNLLQYYMGVEGLPDLLQYYNGVGGLSGPQICIT